MIKLKSLTINFAGCPCLTDSELEILAESIKSIQTLEQLDLDFSDCLNFTDFEVIQLSAGIQKCKCLKRLILDFDKCSQVSIEGILMLKATLLKLKNLLHVYLSLVGTKVTREEAENVHKELQHIVDLIICPRTHTMKF